MYSEHQMCNVQAEGGRYIALMGHNRYLQTEQSIALAYWVPCLSHRGKYNHMFNCKAECRTKSENLHCSKLLNKINTRYLCEVHWRRHKIPTLEQQGLSVSDVKCPLTILCKGNLFEIHEKTT